MLSLHQRFVGIVIATGLIFTSYADALWPFPSDLTVHFLDIGQGDSILIQTPHGRTVLIDGGPSSSIFERLGEVISFWEKSFDLVVLTHPDFDHVEGLIKILDRYQVSAVLFSGIMDGSAAYKAFLEKITKLHIPTTIAEDIKDWQIDDEVFLDIITSPLSPRYFETNNMSIISRIIYRNTSLLLTSDAQREEELALLQGDRDLRAQIMKAGHHGSQTSSTIPLIRAVEAKKAIITSGNNNRYGHPHLETLLNFDEQGIEWKNTKENGTVTIRSNGESWRW